MNSITSNDLVRLQVEGQAITLIDVRREKARQSSGCQISRAQWRNPADWLDWKDHIPKDLPVVVYCAHGHEISQGLTKVLEAMGLNARFLSGGIAAWQAAGLPTQPLT
ncbi:PspE Rhodanese-related sulfurtransferase [Comamonadaceae bacterium]